MGENISTKNIEELKILENNLQLMIQQRQSLQMELNEVENALQELDDYGDEAYKIVSGIMIKTKTEELATLLNEKKEVLEKKIDAVEKQERIVNEKAAEARRKFDKFAGKNR